jgi:hypothetical protein
MHEAARQKYSQPKAVRLRKDGESVLVSPVLLTLALEGACALEGAASLGRVGLWPRLVEASVGGFATLRASLQSMGESNLSSWLPRASQV